ncbi:MAG: GNAT family N-acetyltransferase [Terricaulis sp.]
MDIRAALRSEQQNVMDTLALAFANDPPIRYWWPRASEHLYWWPRFALARGERGFDAQSVMVTPNFEGVAMWMPPGVEADPAQVEALNMPSDEEGDRIAGDLRDEMERFHPTAPHWYLWALGVDPRYQGRGIGAALLRHTLAHIDQRHEMAYLESSDPKNVPFYQRHGFEALGVIQVHDVPPLTPMIRPAR